MIMPNPVLPNIIFWCFGLFSLGCFVWSLAGILQQDNQGPAFCFLLYWAGHLLFSFFGFALYYVLTSQGGTPFARHPDVTASLLLVFSIGCSAAWWSLAPFFRRLNEPDARFKCSPWELWIVFACAALIFFSGAELSGWFRARWETGNTLPPGSPQYWIKGLLALVSPAIYLSVRILLDPSERIKKILAGLFLILAALLFVRTGGRGYVVGLVLVLFFAVSESAGPWKRWTRHAAALLLLGSLFCMSTVTFRGFQNSVYRLAAADPQTVIDLLVEQPGPKIGLKNFERLRHLFLPKIIAPQKKSPDDGPERMKEYGFLVNDFTSYPIGFLADLFERFAWPGIFLASWVCGLALLATGFLIYRFCPPPLAGVFLSSLIFAMPTLPETSLLGFINRMTYQNCRDFFLIGCIAGPAIFISSLRRKVTHPGLPEKPQSTRAF